MYIRTKTRTNRSGKTYTYAYLAEMRQIRSKSKQRVKKYLGRVYVVERTSREKSTFVQSSIAEMLREIMKTELKNHGFQEKGLKYALNDLEIDLETKTIINTATKKKACIQLNQGILCDETLTSLLEYKIPKENIQRIGKDFAKKAIESGLEASNEAIIEVFKKIQTMINNAQQ